MYAPCNMEMTCFKIPCNLITHVFVSLQLSTYTLILPAVLRLDVIIPAPRSRFHHSISWGCTSFVLLKHRRFKFFSLFFPIVYVAKIQREEMACKVEGCKGVLKKKKKSTRLKGRTAIEVGFLEDCHKCYVSVCHEASTKRWQ